MPSFARLFQNEIITKTLYCNRFAIHNTIDIVEVIGSSPTNPTIVKALNPEGIERFSYVMEKHLQYNTCSLVICLIHAGFYQPLWHYKVRSLNLICPVYQEIIGIKKAPVTRHCIKRRRRTDRIFLCMSQGRTCLFCCEKSVAIPKNTIPRSAKTDRKIEYHVRIGESDSG